MISQSQQDEDTHVEECRGVEGTSGPAVNVG